MKNCIVQVGETRWKVKEGRTLSHVINAINHARVTGSIGHTDTVNGVVIAKVIQVNSDNTECQPYTMAY